jgi:hypothetical protein
VRTAGVYDKAGLIELTDDEVRSQFLKQLLQSGYESTSLFQVRVQVRIESLGDLGCHALPRVRMVLNPLEVGNSAQTDATVVTRRFDSLTVVSANADCNI